MAQNNTSTPTYNMSRLIRKSNGEYVDANGNQITKGGVLIGSAWKYLANKYGRDYANRTSANTRAGNIWQNGKWRIDNGRGNDSSWNSQIQKEALAKRKDVKQMSDGRYAFINPKNNKLTYFNQDAKDASMQRKGYTKTKQGINEVYVRNNPTQQKSATQQNSRGWFNNWGKAGDTFVESGKGLIGNVGELVENFNPMTDKSIDRRFWGVLGSLGRGVTNLGGMTIGALANGVMSDDASNTVAKYGKYIDANHYLQDDDYFGWLGDKQFRKDLGDIANGALMIFGTKGIGGGAKGVANGVKTAAANTATRVARLVPKRTLVRGRQLVRDARNLASPEGRSAIANGYNAGIEKGIRMRQGRFGTANEGINGAIQGGRDFLSRRTSRRPVTENPSVNPSVQSAESVATPSFVPESRVPANVQLERQAMQDAAVPRQMKPLSEILNQNRSFNFNIPQQTPNLTMLAPRNPVIERLQAAINNSKRRATPINDADVRVVSPSSDVRVVSTPTSISRRRTSSQQPQEIPFEDPAANSLGLVGESEINNAAFIDMMNQQDLMNQGIYGLADDFSGGYYGDLFGDLGLFDSGGKLLSRKLINKLK